MGIQPLGSETNPQRYFANATASSSGGDFAWAPSVASAASAVGMGLLTATNPAPAPAPSPSVVQPVEAMPDGALVVAPIGQLRAIERRLLDLEVLQKSIAAVIGVDAFDAEATRPEIVFANAFAITSNSDSVADRLDYAVETGEIVHQGDADVAVEGLSDQNPRTRAAAARYIALFAPDRGALLVDLLAVEPEASVRRALEAAVELVSL